MEQSDVKTEDPVLFKMMADELGDGEKTKTALLLGTVITIFFCGVAAVVATVILNLWFTSSGIGLTGWMIVMLLLSGAICFLIDRKTRGKRWADAQIAGPVFQTIVDKALFAHRFVVGGLQRKQRVGATEDERVIARGARLVHSLSAIGAPAMPAKLLEPGDTPQSLDRVIDYLTNRDWIGHSSDGQKIWLSSRGKNLLTQWGLLAAI